MAVSVTDVPWAYGAVHPVVAPLAQSMPPGTEVMRPRPVPVSDTVTACVGSTTVTVA